MSEKTNTKTKTEQTGAAPKHGTLLTDPLRFAGRHWLSASGIAPAQMSHPFVGILVCASDILGASPHLQGLLQNIERGIQQAGGVPFQFRLSGLVEGLAQGHEGDSYLFPRRALLADEVESLARGAGLDGLILVADQNDASAGLLLGAARLPMPSIFVPVNTPVFVEDKAHGPSVDSWQMAAAALIQSRKKPGQTFSPNGHQIRRDDYAHGGMACLAEILGLTMPMAGTAPAGSQDQMRLAQGAGERAVELVRQGVDIRRVLMPNAFVNAARMDAVFGGWSDAVVFLMALAHEVGAKFSLSQFIEIGRRTPQLCQLTGPKGHSLAALHDAGGLPGVLRALKGQWLPHPTVSGRGVNDLMKNAQVKDTRVIHVKTPLRKEGGLTLLRGNLAAHGALFQTPPHFSKKLAAIQGPAKVFDSREAAVDAILQKKIVKGDILIVRHEGPKSGNGFRPLALISHLLAAQGLADQVAVVSDGRLGSPMEQGLFIEMVTPEAAEGSTLSVVRDGDRVDIDIAAQRLMVFLTDTDMKVRLARWQAPAPRSRGFLARQARAAASALEGGSWK